MIDCRPPILPVSIPLSVLSPGTIADAREISSFQPSQETGKSIMDMDTNEITINRIVGFQWDDPGTDLEDEMPTPVVSPVQNVAPVIPPAETADPFDRGDDFDLDLAKVMLDASVMPSLISPLEEYEVPPPSRAAEYAAPATPVLETVFESPGYTVPEESAFTWIPGFVPVPEAVLVEEGGTNAATRSTASASGSGVGRGTGRQFGDCGTVYPDDAADPGRYETRYQYRECPTDRSG